MRASAAREEDKHDDGEEEADDEEEEADDEEEEEGDEEEEADDEDADDNDGAEEEVVLPLSVFAVDMGAGASGTSNVNEMLGSDMRLMVEAGNADADASAATSGAGIWRMSKDPP